MAGDYIPFDHDFPEKPETIAIHEKSGVTIAEIMLRCHKLWRAFDRHTVDGFLPNVGPKGLAALCGGDENFWILVAEMGWLIFHDGGVEMPGFAQRLCGRRGCAMNTEIITFEVFGKQSPQGSKIAQVIYRRDAAGKPVPVMKNGRVITVARNDCDNLQSWRGAVIDAARRAYSGPLLTGAISFEVWFYRPRPKAHFTAAGKLKASAPVFPLPKPDNSKLRRAIEDSLTGVLYRDDALITDGADHKRFGECYRTVVTVNSLDGATEERW